MPEPIGILLMLHEDRWFVETVATLDQSARVESIALSSTEIPHSQIYSIKRSRQPIVIVDAVIHPTLATDTSLSLN